MYKAILFDLDGTLLPMNQDEFTQVYFGLLGKYFATFGYDPKKLLNAVIQGTKAMVKNNGESTNERVFWQTFRSLVGDEGEKDKFLRFYDVEFNLLKQNCAFNPLAGEVVKNLKNKGFTLVLATNPVFPMTAQLARMGWAGLDKNDFSYITSYENSHFCKPNPSYYSEILQKLGLKSGECLMIGNDCGEDGAATKIGIDVFLITDYLLGKRESSSKITYGDFAQFNKFIKGLNYD